jgi:hypothetical protein
MEQPCDVFADIDEDAEVGKPVDRTSIKSA